MGKLIYQAGPQALGSNAFLPVEDDDPEASPVNCANNQHPRWRWRARFVKDGTGTADGVDEAALNEDYSKEVSVTGDEVVTAFRFAYQAAEDWSFNGSFYAFNTEPVTTDPMDVVAVILVVDLPGIAEEVFDDFDTGGSASITGNLDSVVFPASETPQPVEIRIVGGSGFGFGNVEVSGELRLPINTFPEPA